MLANALIVVDVQQDFCPGGSLAVPHGNDVARRIHTFVQEHSDDYHTIVASKCWHPDDIGFEHFSKTPDYKNTWPIHCVAGTSGADFHPWLNAYDPSSTCPLDRIEDYLPVEFDKIFYKGQKSAAYSAFEGGDGGLRLQDSSPKSVEEVGHDPLTLNSYFERQGIKHVDVCGIATDYCVKQTALDSAFYGYDTSVLTTLCAGVSRETSVDAIRTMLNNGVHVDGWWG